MTDKNRIESLTLDESTIRYRNPEIGHEREMAITDLLHHNEFSLTSNGQGPYRLHLSAVDQKLYMRVSSDTMAEPQIIVLSMSGFRKIIKDYFMMWEAYNNGLANSTPEKLQALDMGRRAVHDEGSKQLIKTLAENAHLDFNTARRLFTLICILHLN